MVTEVVLRGTGVIGQATLVHDTPIATLEEVEVWALGCTARIYWVTTAQRANCEWLLPPSIGFAFKSMS